MFTKFLIDSILSFTGERTDIPLRSIVIHKRLRLLLLTNLTHAMVSSERITFSRCSVLKLK